MCDLDKFQSGLAQILFGNYGDSQFEVIRTICKGMSGVKTGKLLNFAVSCLEEDELYFEIGVYRGFTMISAGLGQKRNIVGIDNFSEFGNNKATLTANLNALSSPNYQFIEADFRQIGIDEKNKGKTGILYIDGKHEYQEVMDTFAWAENGILSDKSLIVIDDLAVNGVSQAVNEWVSTHPEYKTIFYMKPYFDDSNGSWSHDISIGLGLAILKREKA